jgi:ubiquitin C-terminal hydrolase
MAALTATPHSAPEADDSSSCYEECHMSQCQEEEEPPIDDEEAADCDNEHCDEDDDYGSCATTVVMEDAEEPHDGIDNDADVEVEEEDHFDVDDSGGADDDGGGNEESARFRTLHDSVLPLAASHHAHVATSSSAAPPASAAPGDSLVEDAGTDKNDTDGTHIQQEVIPELCSETSTDAEGAGAAAAEAAADSAAEIDSAMDAALEDADEAAGVQLSSSPFAPTEVVGGRRYGGLLNLGNTCYMASALQMLASAEAFVESVRDREPPRHGDDAAMKLRGAFLDVMDRLRRGETVSPGRFKQAVDERSPLFVGFEQQDAHEFFTTLLDLIDEDFKKVVESNDEAETKPSPEALETTMMEPSCVDGEQEGDSSSSMVSDDLEGHLKSDPDLSRKKPRTGEACESFASQQQFVPEREGTDSVAPSPTSWLTATCRNSFSELNLDEIGHLLHDTNPSNNESLSLSSSLDPFAPHPRYKLVGGRMNTADVVLTPYASACMFTDDTPSVAAVARDDAEAAMFATAAGAAPSSTATPVPPSPVDSHFKLSARVRLTCDSCKYSRCHDESFLHLSLEIGPGCGSVDDGLRRFFSPETREIKCEKCFGESATQTMEITELPKALVVHFKRFIVEVSSDYSSVSYRKNQSAVSFDPEMSLEAGPGSVLAEFLAHDCEPPVSTGKPLSYCLRSVVNHMGASASCGHYTADAFREYEGSNDDDSGSSSGERRRRWTRFNDSLVTPISASDAIESSQRTAYLALYELAAGDCEGSITAATGYA